MKAEAKESNQEKESTDRLIILLSIRWLESINRLAILLGSWWQKSMNRLGILLSGRWQLMLVLLVLALLYFQAVTHFTIPDDSRDDELSRGYTGWHGSPDLMTTASKPLYYIRQDGKARDEDSNDLNELTDTETEDTDSSWLDSLEATGDYNKFQEGIFVHDGYLTLETENRTRLEEVVDQIETLVTSKGNGYVRSNNFYVDGCCGRRAVSLDLQIVSQKFMDVFQAIQHLVGKEMVMSASKSTRDATEEFLDALSRAKVLGASLKSLDSPMEMDTIKTRKEKNKSAEEHYEGVSIRSAVLQRKFKMSTLTVRVEEKEQPRQHTLSFNPKFQMKRAMHEIIEVISVAGDFLVYAGIWLLPFLFVFALIMVCWSNRKKMYYVLPRNEIN